MGQTHTSRPTSVRVGFCSAQTNTIQAQRLPAYNQTHSAMGHEASLAQLHPEPFAMDLLVLFTTDSLQILLRASCILMSYYIAAT